MNHSFPSIKIFIIFQGGSCEGRWVCPLAPEEGPRLTLTKASSYGEFEATRDCSDFTSASFLSKAGKKTPVLQRVSTVGPESGSADTSRDVHGWSMKLYTDEGNLDWVFNNTV